MTERLNPQQVALLIRARQILKAKKLAKDADVKSICEAAGISRKTGYQWANNLDPSHAQKDHNLGEELARLEAEHEDLKARCRRLEIENEGRKLAWEIHGVDELLAAKKNTTRHGKKKKP
jgi:transposase